MGLGSAADDTSRQRVNEETCNNIMWTAAQENLSLGFPTKSYPIVSEYDQEIPQSQIADNPVAPRGRATQPSRDTRKTN